MKVAESLYKPGDWVRFMSGGKLVIGQVEYVRQGEALYYKVELVTTHGVMQHDSVLEGRSADK